MISDEQNWARSTRPMISASCGKPRDAGSSHNEVLGQDIRDAAFPGHVSRLLEGDDVRLVVGTPGGPTIINTVFQIIMDILDHGLSPQEAVDLPRFHHQWLPDAIQLRKGRWFSTYRLLWKAKATNCWNVD